jgi:ribosomal protein S27AE
VIVRKIETCPKCGKWQPWRKYSTRVIKGERRIYVKCVRCGAREVVVYRRANG